MNRNRMRTYRNGTLFFLAMTLLFVSRVMPVCVSGFVTDANGNPVANADIDFFVVATGVKLVTPGDNTDTFGFFNVCVLPGVYKLTFAPPPGSHLMGGQLLNIDLSSNLSLDTSIVLNLGVVVSGTVTDSLGTPLGAVDLDFDEVTGGRVFTPSDNSDTLTGDYWVVVPPGIYRIRYDAPPGTRYRGLQLDSVAVAADAVIDVALAEGWLLSGRVSDPGDLSLFDVEVDLREEVTGSKVFVSNNDTDTSGSYQVAVPDGLFQLRFLPPLGSNLIGAKFGSVTISGDLVWDQTLLPGVILAVAVTDTSGAPISGADLDLKLNSTGEKIFTPHDKTDGQGRASVAIPPGTYTVQLDPPVGSLFDRVVIDSVSIQNDTAIVLIMPEVPRVSFSGRVTDGFGRGVAGVQIDLRTRPTGSKVFLLDNTTDSTGAFGVSAPIGNLDLLLSPPRGSRYLGRIIENIIIANDTAIGDLVLTEGVLVTVVVEGEFGESIAGVDLDFTSETNGLEIFTPFDNTDQDGITVVAVPVDRYTVELSPTSLSGYLPLLLFGVTIISDTTLSVTLAGQANSESRYLQQNYPNPVRLGTNIRYIIPTSGQASLTIYNVLGQTVKVLNDTYHAASSYYASWDGTNHSGRPVASGPYFYRLIAPGIAETRKMIVIR